MYIWTFTTLIITSNPPISKSTCACLAPFLSPLTQLFPTLVWQRLQGHVTQSLVFLEAESQLQFGISGRRFFPKVDAIMNLKPFDVMFIIRLHFLSYYVFICCRPKMTRVIMKVVIIDFAIFEEKYTKIGTNASKKNYIAAEKLEMRRPFTFFVFQNLDLVVN